MQTRMHLYGLWARGVIGWIGEAKRDYQILNAVHELQRTVYSLTGRRSGRAPTFEKIFPEIDELIPRAPTPDPKEVDLGAKVMALRESWEDRIEDYKADKDDG